MENVTINTRKKFDMDKYFSQVKVVSPSNIKKVVDVNVKTNVTSTEITNNFLIVGGKLCVNVVYLNEENAFENCETTIDFLEKQKVGCNLTELYAVDNVFVEHFETLTSEVMCSVEHNTSVYGIYPYSVGLYSDNEKDYVLNKKSVECFNFLSSADDNFVVAEEIETNLKNITVLSNNSTVSVLGVAATVDKVVVDGKVTVSATYVDEEGFGEFNKEFEFKQEIALKNSMPGMFADAVLKVTNVSIVPENKEGKTVVTFVIDLTGKSYLFENKVFETYDDLFSLKNEVVPVYDYLEISQNEEFKFEVDTILTQTEISMISDFDDIVGVFSPKMKVLSVEEKDDRLIVNGLISAVALYKTPTAVEPLNLSYETKFETTKEYSKTLSGIECFATVSAFKVKAGKDLECAFVANYKFVFEKFQSEQFVKSFEIKNEKIDDESAIKVYVTKDSQTVFDVAKALNVRPESILNQNEVSGCFESGQKVYVYTPLNV